MASGSQKMNPPKADELDYIHFLIVSLGADILTGDEDFFGCGIATWTVDTLIPHLERRDAGTA
jgi:hypothetical protein